MNTLFIKKSSTETGFSLVELVCALSVISVGFFGILHLMHIALNHTRALQEYRVAHEIIENTLEELRSEAYETMEAGVFPLDQATLEESGLHLAEGSLSIQAHPDSLVWEITVKLRWVGDKGRVIQRQLSTLAGPIS